MSGLAMRLGLGLSGASKGVPASVVVNGVIYTRIMFGGLPLDIQISSQPLYGR